MGARSRRRVFMHTLAHARTCHDHAVVLCRQGRAVTRVPLLVPLPAHLQGGAKGKCWRCHRLHETEGRSHVPRDAGSWEWCAAAADVARTQELCTRHPCPPTSSPPPPSTPVLHMHCQTTQARTSSASCRALWASRLRLMARAHLYMPSWHAITSCAHATRTHYQCDISQHIGTSTQHIGHGRSVRGAA